MRATLPSGTPVEIAVPPRPASRGVVLYPDIWGLRPLFDELAAELADQRGWAVAEVELFPGLEPSASVDDRFAAVPTNDDALVLADTLAAADLLVERAAVDRIAVMGFCIGGMYAYKAAAATALRPGGVVLRDDPDPSRMARSGAGASRSRSSASATPARCSPSWAARTPIPRRRTSPSSAGSDR